MRTKEEIRDEIYCLIKDYRTAKQIGDDIQVASTFGALIGIVWGCIPKLYSEIDKSEKKIETTVEMIESFYQR